MFVNLALLIIEQVEVKSVISYSFIPRNIASFVRDLIELIKFMFSSEAEGYKTKNISLRFRVNYSFLLFYSPQSGSQGPVA